MSAVIISEWGDDERFEFFFVCFPNFLQMNSVIISVKRKSVIIITNVAKHFNSWGTVLY